MLQGAMPRQTEFKQTLCADINGFSLHAAERCAADIVDAVARSARVTVPDYQLSLAIGREGQNARLAARLTGWRIDIRPDTDEGATPSGPPDPASSTSE